MKRIRRAYSKTVSLIDETAVQIYQSFVGKKKGFLLESYDKNNGRYVFMGKNPEEVIKSKEDGLVIERADGTTKELSGNPVDLLKGYYSDFEIHKDDEQLAFTGGLVGGLGYDFVRYKEELPDNSSRRIFVFERASQFALLSQNPETFMWVSSIPQSLLDRYGLVERKSNENERVYKDVLIYRKEYTLSRLDGLFIEQLVQAKRRVMK